MLKDITLGQYYQTDSILHRLDPRVKLVTTLIYIIGLFVCNSLLGYAVSALFLIVMIILSNVPFKYMIRGMRSIMALLLITVIFNIFLTKGTVLWSLGPLTITKEGCTFAAMMAVRLCFILIGSSLMTLTTTPTALTDAMENLLRPLNRIHVPVHEISMMMSIALRFIPILMEEADKIMKAQMARGANFDSNKLIEKVKSLIPLLVPLFVSAFRRANDLAMAMEARCYRGGDGRTRMKPLKYRSSDYVSYLIVVAFFAFCICSRVFRELLPLSMGI